MRFIRRTLVAIGLKPATFDGPSLAAGMGAAQVGRAQDLLGQFDRELRAHEAAHAVPPGERGRAQYLMAQFERELRAHETAHAVPPREGASREVDDGARAEPAYKLLGPALAASLRGDL